MTCTHNLSLSISESAKTKMFEGSVEALMCSTPISSETSSTLSKASGSNASSSPSSSSELLSSSVSAIVGCPSGKAVSIRPLTRAAITKLLSSDSNSSKSKVGSVTLSTKDRSINIESEEDTIRGSKVVFVLSN